MKPHQVSSAQKLARSWKPKSLLKEFPPKQQPPALSSIPAETADRLTQGEALAKLLSLGVPINRDTLRKVVKKDNLGLLKLFHRAGADLNTGLGNYRDLSPLYLSIDWGARNVYRYLMDNAADINKRSLRSGMAPLVRAIAWGRWDIVNELLDAGADVSQSPETLPGKGSSLIKGTPLSYAVQFSENPVLIYRLLNAGARTDERYLHGSTPLHQAVSAGFVENSRVLIKAGANPNSTNKFGITPIFEAVKVKTLTKVEILRLLIKGGASVKQIDQSKPSILFWASYKGRTDLINLFIRSGADVNERYYFKDDTTPMIVSEDPILKEVTKNGSTPLHVAAKLGHFSAVKALIKAGANHSIVVRMGAKSHSVISLAKQSGNTTLYKFLKHR